MYVVSRSLIHCFVATLLLGANLAMQSSSRLVMRYELPAGWNSGRKQQYREHLMRSISSIMEDVGAVLMLSSALSYLIVEINNRRQCFWRGRRLYSTRPLLMANSIGVVAVALANMINTCFDT